jgi:hypothetical protein
MRRSGHSDPHVLRLVAVHPAGVEASARGVNPSEDSGT